MGLKKNLIEYLINISDKKTAAILELLKYNLGSSIDHYGDHFNKIEKKFINNPFIFLKFIIEYFILYILSYKIDKKTGKNIFSTATSKWNRHIREKGFNVYSTPWGYNRYSQINFPFWLFLMTKKIQYKIKNSSFNYLVSNQFILEAEEYLKMLKDFVKLSRYDALIISGYNDFFDKSAIKIFKDLNLPVFFWHHGGIPAYYDKEHQKRADYFVLMGERQVNDFKKVGFKKTKFFAAGHPKYNCKPSNLKFSLNKILIITKAPAGYSPLEEPSLDIRSNSVMYLYSIQKVLKSLGVKNTRLRPHPSENSNWYKKVIDNSFYSIDNDSLENSIKNSTLIIGPISTTLIDSLYHGINYVLYEPLLNNKTILGYPVTPPIDGNDSSIPTAHNEKELYSIIKDREKISIKVYGELVQTPRDISFLNDLI